MRDRICDTAEKLAEKLHAGQKQGDEDYFWGHVWKVYWKVREYVCKNEWTKEDFHHPQTAALLHDVLEDCAITKEQLYARLVTDSSYCFSFTENEWNVQVDCLKLMDTLDALTKRKNESYTSYINRVKQNKYAAIVKYFDSEANMYACIAQGDEKRARKYLKNMCELSEFVKGRGK